MFGIGGWEFILIAVLALLLFGPDKLPQFARTIGRFMRDFKRYQDLMESTIRAEVFANDTSVKKDAFATGKEFRERVGGGGFRRQQPSAPVDGTDEAEEAPDAETAADDAAAQDASLDQSTESEAAAQAPEPEAETAGEGEQGEA